MSVEQTEQALEAPKVDLASGLGNLDDQEFEFIDNLDV